MLFSGNLHFSGISADSGPGNGAVSCMVFEMKNHWNDILNAMGMRDNADQFSVLFESGELFECMLESFFIKGSEPLVEEKSVDSYPIACHAGKSECKSQTDEKGLSAGKIPGRTDFISAVGIFYIEFESVAGIGGQSVAVAEFFKLSVGVLKECFKCERLDKGSIFFPVAGADQIIQELPFPLDGAFRFYFRDQGGCLFPVLIGRLEPGKTFSDQTHFLLSFPIQLHLSRFQFRF